ncbi:MAG: triose-phosphate isomerase [Candidatus Woesearchaeota archaeon]
MCFFSRKVPVVRQLDYSRPFVILNFKTYKESIGDNALRLAKIAEKVGAKHHINMIVCVQAIDLKNVASQVKIPVYAQHVDSNMLGKSTGSIIPEILMDINVHGSLLNHSEKKVDLKIVDETVLRLKEVGMTSIVCTDNNVHAKKISGFKRVKPDFIAIEPPELIGTEKSVSTSKPELIEKAVKACSGLNVLAGAGIKDNTDFKTALKLGCKGVLLSSHFVKSSNPEKFLEELVMNI